MAIAAAMSHEDDKDEHEQDVVMPGFRFHPTEEELIEFYLRRKIEGKRFNVELIAFLDLYRYDPWELPDLAAIGEKEWYFYVPRDRKYRNGDRPNRVTTSGYWKATGADRMIRTEDYRPIGLKKTLVFYSGKAPKGIRTSWIMNEYRLPQHETDRYQKAEISLCRVYKRAGVEDHSPLPNSLPSTSSSCRLIEYKNHMGLQATTSLHSSSSETEKFHLQSYSSSMDTASALVLPRHRAYSAFSPVTPIGSSSVEVDGTLLQIQNQTSSSLPSSSCTPVMTADDLHRLADYQHIYAQQMGQNFPSPASQEPLLTLNTLPNSLSTISDKLWEWNPIPDVNRDYTTFK